MRPLLLESLTRPGMWLSCGRCLMAERTDRRYPMTPWNPLGPDQLIAELTARAPQPGANTGSWPGLTIYKSTGPTERTWGESNSLLLCILVQGREAATIGSETYLYGP